MLSHTRVRIYKLNRLIWNDSKLTKYVFGLYFCYIFVLNK